MRRFLIPVVLAALTGVPTAAAEFRPVKRDFGELHIPLVRAGKAEAPPGHRNGTRIRVIMTLKLPPLAQAFQRSLYSTGSARRLNVHTASAQAYLARIDAQQRTAIAQLKRALPAAQVSRRFRIILNGITVSIPAKQLPQLSRQSFAARVWPSYTFRLNLNRSPSIVGADVFHATTGANGEGVKIGVVDDGIDNTSTFLGGDGFSAPAGFPLGQTTYTNAKVIVARAFPGPGAPKEAAEALDRNASFHGTHVAGIAAGNAGTCAPAGRDHPATCGLSGVAPKAYLGNYRVFSLPTPIGNIAESPEIAAAFEAAVADGMDVINFSGGGPTSEPLNDVLIPATANVAAAGVVPVFSAGNDRDDFGFGTVGSPGTAPDAISVAAVSNSQVFAPALTAFNAAGGQVARMPIATGGAETPAAWESANQVLADVSTIVGRNGQPVDRKLCGPPSDPNGPDNQLPAGSLSGMIALVDRGTCTFASKAGRAQQAGAAGLVLVDNRFGEANPIPILLQIPAGMIADADGAALRAAMGGTGRITIRVGRSFEDILTGRSGIVTSFSSAGPTAFGHLLKPDVAAPGGQILSSTLTNAGGPFAVFDGTSMAAPHVTGVAALLVQRHPSWSPQQVKSALMSTAGAAWGNTERTREAAVTLEGAGLVNVVRADDPQIFTEPSSLSLGVLNISGGARDRAQLLRLTDAGGGAGDWTLTLQSQSATSGVSLSFPSTASVPPGGEADLAVIARAAANATPGDQMGFVVATKGSVTRRIPYYFEVTKPALANVPATELAALQLGNTITGTSAVSVYRFPSWAFGPTGQYASGAPMNEAGAEKLYTIMLSEPVINFGVSVLGQSANSQIDPFVLGSKDENDVQGYAGLPVNVNGLMYDYRADTEAAGVEYPMTKRYYVSVDSGTDLFTGQSLPGEYALRAWVNDVTPPEISLITTTLSAGRPTVVMRVGDGQSGIDPLSLILGYNGNVLVGASAFDPATGLALFVIPPQAPVMTAGKKKAFTLIASDNQETKNINVFGANVLPNTNFNDAKIDVVSTPTVAWLVPDANACLKSTTRLAAIGGSTRKVSSITFSVDGKSIGTGTADSAGIAFRDWNPAKAKKGKHELKATVKDAGGRTASVTRTVRTGCKT